jgi:DNA-binding response OmpR family regulator
MSQRKILLVDDSETFLLMEQRMLKPQAYQIITAKNGKEGIAKALEAKPDLILMDVVMPEMDGFTAVKRLREHQTLQATPIIMVTTQSEADSMEMGYQNGCNDYIVKPIDQLELVAKVQNLLGE